MRAKEFLLETGNIKIDIDSIVSQVKQHCQPYLSQSSLPLFRGMPALPNQKIFALVQTQSFRTPRDTPEIINNYIVSWFKDKFGIPFRQQHTLFATGAHGAAENYGKAFVIFPVGEFQYCWSQKYSDLTVQFYYLQSQNLSASEIQAEVIKVMENGDYILNSRLEDATRLKQEVMIYCKEYYALSWEDLMAATNLYGNTVKVYQSLFLP